MDAALGLEHAEGVRTFDAEVDVLVACLFAGLDVVLLDLPALALGVALVHAVEHRHPVARLGAALAGVELHEHVALVELAAEQRLEAELREEALGLGAFDEHIAERCLAGLALLGLGKLEHHLGVLDRLREAVERHHVGALRVGRGDRLARLGLIAPEVCRRLLGLERGELGAALLHLDVAGHLADARLEVRDLLPDLLCLKQLFLLLLRHSARIIPFFVVRGLWLVVRKL